MSQFKYSAITNGLKGVFKMDRRRIVDTCKAAGLDGIEWGLSKDLDEVAAEIKEMKQMTEDAGLEVMGYVNAGKLWKHDEMRRWSEIVASVGGKRLRVSHPWIAMSFDESLHQRDSYWDIFKLAKDGLPGLIEIGKEFGIRYVLEMHAGALTASAFAARRLLDGLDANHIGVIYDPGNTIVEGALRPRSEVEILGDYLAYVHAKNMMWTPTGRSIAEPVRRAKWGWARTDLDAGISDYVEVFFALKNGGFGGWISSEEYFHEAEDPAAKIREGVAFLKECAAKAPSAPQEPYTTFNE